MANAAVKISDLHHCEYNPRKITEDELDRLGRSISDHTGALADWDASKGYRMMSTITVNRNGKRIVGGHQRVKAMERLGQDWIDDRDITWVDLEPESSKEKALNLALNSQDAAGDFDWEKVQMILHDLDAEGFDLQMTALADYTIEPLIFGSFKKPEKDKSTKSGNQDGGEGDAGTIIVTLELTEEQNKKMQEAMSQLDLTEPEDLLDHLCSKLLDGGE